jgi:exonuclease VII small subunit
LQYEKQIKELETVTTRLRGERDSLKKSLESKESTSSISKAIKEMKEILISKDNEIKRLRDQV